MALQGAVARGSRRIRVLYRHLPARVSALCRTHKAQPAGLGPLVSRRKRADRQRRATESLVDRRPEVADDPNSVGLDPLGREVQQEDSARDEPVVAFGGAILIFGGQVVGTGVDRGRELR